MQSQHSRERQDPLSLGLLGECFQIGDSQPDEELQNQPMDVATDTNIHAATDRNETRLENAAQTTSPHPAAVDIAHPLLSQLSIPDSLWVTVRRRDQPILAKTGGAVIDASKVTQNGGDFATLWKAVLTKRLNNKMLLLEHLDASHHTVTPEHIHRMMQHAINCGEQWHLRSLVLRNCNLTFAALEQLVHPDCCSALSNLERLDLSRNPSLGSLVPGGPCDADDANTFDSYNTKCLWHLWQNAPLKLLNLQHTGLTDMVLTLCLFYMLDMPGTSQSSRGTCKTLQCLKLGPLPNNDRFTPRFVDMLVKIIKEVPTLQVIEVIGLGAQQKETLKEAWAEAHRECVPVSTDDNVLRVCAGDAAAAGGNAAVEKSPREHILPQPNSPRQQEQQAQPLHEEVARLDLEYEQLRSQHNAITHFHDNLQSIRNDRKTTAADYQHATLPPRDPVAAATAHRQVAAGQPRQRNAVGVRRSRKDTQSTLHGFDGFNERLGTSGTRRSTGGGAAGGNARAPRSYSGSRADQLPVFGEVSLEHGDDRADLEMEEEPEYDDMTDDEGSGFIEDDGGDVVATLGLRADDDDDKEEERGGAGREKNTSNNRPAARQGGDATQELTQRFKMRDGAIDDDSKMGRIYRKRAKELATSLPDPDDKKRALAAYRLWDGAINAWDRRRWINKSKDQHDLEETLGQLNLLFDLLAKYGKDTEFGFPFPDRKPGQGASAFIKSSASRPEDVRPDVHLPPPRVVATDSVVEQKKRTSDQGAKSNKQNKKVKRFMDDGGRGRGSDAEEDSQDGSGFVVGDDHESSSSDDSDGDDGQPVQQQQQQGTVPPGAIIDSQEDSLAFKAAATTTGKRVIIPDSDDDDDEAAPAVTGSGGSHPTAAAKKVSRAQREAARLSAWGWDSRIEEHPPNEERYARAEGKRTRRQLSTTQIKSLIVSQEEELTLDEMELLNGLGDGITAGEAPPPAESDSDLDEPLLPQPSCKKTSPPLPLPPANVPAATVPPSPIENNATPVVVKLPDQSPVDKKPSPAEAAAKALLGNLYSAAPQPEEEEEVQVQAMIVPDSQPEEQENAQV